MGFRLPASCLAAAVFLATSALADDYCEHCWAMLFITNDTGATLTLQTQSYYGKIVSDVITLPPGEQVGELQTRAGRQYLFAEARLSDPPLEARLGDRFFHGGQEYFISIGPSHFGRDHVSDAAASEAPAPQPASAANWCARISGTWNWFIGTVDFTGTGDANQAHGSFTSGDDLHGDWSCVINRGGVMVTMTWSHGWTDELSLVNPNRLEGEGWKTGSIPHEGVHDVSGTRSQ
jgi:hypothetical protein